MTRTGNYKAGPGRPTHEKSCNDFACDRHEGRIFCFHCNHWVVDLEHRGVA